MMNVYVCVVRRAARRGATAVTVATLPAATPTATRTATLRTATRILVRLVLARIAALGARRVCTFLDLELWRRREFHRALEQLLDVAQQRYLVR